MAENGSKKTMSISDRLVEHVDNPLNVLILGTGECERNAMQIASVDS